jgi:hypothetical protein
MIPVFEGTIAVESGLGTADVMLRLLNTNTIELPFDGLFLQSGSTVTLTLHTPYWAAWMTYFGTNPSLTGDVSCTLAGTACPAVISAVYQPAGPLATVTLSLPAQSLDVTVASFALSLT